MDIFARIGLGPRSPEQVCQDSSAVRDFDVCFVLATLTDVVETNRFVITWNVTSDR